MKPFRTLIIVISVSLAMASCSTTRNTSIVPFTDDVYYTQINMWAYKGNVDTLNYSIEVKIPVNTPVRISYVDTYYISFDTEDGSGPSYRVVKNYKYTRLLMQEVFYRYFNLSKVDLSRFPDVDQDFIKWFDGYYHPGVSKEAVIIGRGYPPEHRTPSLDGNTWIYWRNRWKSKSLEFVDGKTVNLNGSSIQPR